MCPAAMHIHSLSSPSDSDSSSDSEPGSPSSNHIHTTRAPPEDATLQLSGRSTPRLRDGHTRRKRDLSCSSWDGHDFLDLDSPAAIPGQSGDGDGLEPPRKVSRQEVIHFDGFVVDASPGSFLDSSCMSIYDRKFTLVIGEVVIEAKPTNGGKRAQTCFNCGQAGHIAPKCPMPKNHEMIRANRDAYMEAAPCRPQVDTNLRFWEPSEVANPAHFAHLKPGILSTDLITALGMDRLDPPPWLPRMRRYGYPPGYMAAAASGDASASAYAVLSSAVAVSSSQQLVQFPGLNAPIPDGADPSRWNDLPSAGPSSESQPESSPDALLRSASSSSINSRALPRTSSNRLSSSSHGDSPRSHQPPVDHRRLLQSQQAAHETRLVRTSSGGTTQQHNQQQARSNAFACVPNAITAHITAQAQAAAAALQANLRMGMGGGVYPAASHIALAAQYAQYMASPATAYANAYYGAQAAAAAAASQRNRR
mmetsp:Transcript_102/g.221  ORF Transcript_102/g.221 Transcript_102/m.221 type:complete len:479 (-) Transcript_102:771-2207(-)|eukprot:CAMPEP_0196665108 /NCGR_PEP_ID=MMETSP1086-20130531/59663_1 /TAXON_ID=77921 /ORGANISM="Cyanoptyche  gloeocystis , Strain SAG4.97" /LENGTH=478 /DNA_ID=CAMNT_0042001703 /DNA_START=149 /DNA_END=1585 /DNA_ORIENTATION=+